MEINISPVFPFTCSHVINKQNSPAFICSTAFLIKSASQNFCICLSWCLKAGEFLLLIRQSHLEYPNAIWYLHYPYFDHRKKVEYYASAVTVRGWRWSQFLKWHVSVCWYQLNFFFWVLGVFFLFKMLTCLHKYKIQTQWYFEGEKTSLCLKPTIFWQDT